MINRKEVTIQQLVIESITCDFCNVTFTEIMDLQEFLRIDFVGGYGSVFGDGTKVECDICQNCLHKLIKDVCKETDMEV